MTGLLSLRLYPDILRSLTILLAIKGDRCAIGSVITCRTPDDQHRLPLIVTHIRNGVIIRDNPMSKLYQFPPDCVDLGGINPFWGQDR